MILFLNDTRESPVGMGKTLSDSDPVQHAPFVASLWPEQVSQALWAVQKEPRVLPSCVGVQRGMNLRRGPVLSPLPFS